MTELVTKLFQDLSNEFIGLLGGAMFLGSWILQSLQSKAAGSPVVSLEFFLIRCAACLLLTYEGLRTGSLSVTIVMFATFLMMAYNVALILARR